MSRAPDPPTPTAVGGLGAVSLEQIAATADLQRRFDRKYVLELDLLDALIGRLGDVRALEVGGRRRVAYRSVYFDTPELRSYRDHLKRRRQRFKVRTRDYGDPAAVMLEVKVKDRRGQTVKHRWPHPGDHPRHLGPEAQRLVSAVLEDRYGFACPERLEPTATTTYDRVTLVDLAQGERITIDLGLEVDANGRSLLLGRDHATVEVKSARRRGPASDVLLSMGRRPVRVSKYCLGIAASQEAIPGNPWLPVLRRVAPHLATARP
jgi:hypothetical protein